MSEAAFLSNLLSDAPLDRRLDRFQRRLWETRAETGPCRGPWVARSAAGPIVVPCGNCFPCKVRRRQAAIGLAMAELHSLPCAEVFTLTYTEDYLPDFSERTIGQEWDRVRKQLARHIGPFRYWWVFQLGTQNGRPHWHVIVWYLRPRDIARRRYLVRPGQDGVWPYGGRMVDALTPQSARYVLGYITEDGKGTVKSARSKALGEAFILDWIDREVAHRDRMAGIEAARLGVSAEEIIDQWPDPYGGFVLDGRQYPFTRKMRLIAQEKGLLSPLSDRDREAQVDRFVSGGEEFGGQRGADYVSEKLDEQRAHARRLALADLVRNPDGKSIHSNALAEFRLVQAHLRRRGSV